MAAGESEVASGNVTRAPIEAKGFGLVAKPGEGFGVVNRLKGQIGSETEWKAAGEQKAVPRVKEHRLRDALDDQPALTGEHGIAFDSLVLGKVDGHVALNRETAGDVDLRLHEGKDFGERVHALGRSEAWWEGRGGGDGSSEALRLGLSAGDLRRQDDWTNHTDFQYRSSAGRDPSID